MLASDVGGAGSLAERAAEAWPLALGQTCRSGSSSSAAAGLVAAGPEPELAPVG